jgi:hypothetical protein
MINPMHDNSGCAIVHTVLARVIETFEKVKFTLKPAMQAQRGSRGMDLFFL